MQRKVPFINEEFHHIYNRGVDKRNIFLDRNDYERFLVSMYLLNTAEDGLMNKWRDFQKFNLKAQPSDFKIIKPKEKLVDFNCYCLNDNHYHFILGQLQDRGTELFMQKLGTSYTMYFNKKYERSGSLFQGTFKSVYVSENKQLLYLSAYVNKNHFIHGCKEGDSWKYSSLNEYLNKSKAFYICNKSPILDQFKNVKEYQDYINANALQMRENKEMAKMSLE
jgi:putative transposase